MDNPLLVCRFERLGNLLRDRQRLVNRNRPLGDVACKRWPLDELHHECCRAGRTFQAVNRGDVRMIQRRENFGLALEAGQTVSIGRERVRQHFDSNGAL